MQIRSSQINFSFFCAAAVLSLSPLLLNASPVSADEAVPATPIAATQIENNGIEPNDELTISVVNFPTMTPTVTVVPLNGEISLPLVGQVLVTGKSTDQIAKELTTDYSQYLINPFVNVSLTQKHAQNVTIGGIVAKPGTIEYKQGLHLIDAIYQAGGPGPGADMSEVSVVQPDGSKQIVDLTDVESKVGSPADLVLGEDDAVYIPQSLKEISVVGQVKSPGSFAFHEQMTVLDAITDAGGVIDNSGLPNATITNGDTSTSLDLTGLILKGDNTNNVLLKPGDTLTIPLGKRNYVFGAVNRPGYYPYLAGDRVLDALNGAGGATSDADTGKVFVIHIAEDNGSAKSTQVNLTKFFKTGDMTSNLALNPGDIVYVSDKKKPMDLSGLFAVLDAASVARFL